jgi:putative hydrolase of HD superfamily
MEVKSPPPIDGFDRDALPAAVRLYLELCQLKQLYRQGWLDAGVPGDRCETVAEHSFGVAVLALLLAPDDLDRDRSVRMALLHDFGEIHAGDLTPRDGVPAIEKHRRERESVCAVLGGRPDSKELIELWEEYEAGETREARFVREIDRIEMALQGLVYEEQGFGGLGGFFRSTERAVRSRNLSQIVDAVIGLRSRKD